MLQPCLLNLALGIKTSSLNFMFSVIEKNVGVVEHEVERKKRRVISFRQYLQTFQTKQHVSRHAVWCNGQEEAWLWRRVLW